MVKLCGGLDCVGDREGAAGGNVLQNGRPVRHSIRWPSRSLDCYSVQGTLHPQGHGAGPNIAVGTQPSTAAEPSVIGVGPEPTAAKPSVINVVDGPEPTLSTAAEPSAIGVGPEPTAAAPSVGDDGDDESMSQDTFERLLAEKQERKRQRDDQRILNQMAEEKKD